MFLNHPLSPAVQLWAAFAAGVFFTVGIRGLYELVGSPRHWFEPRRCERCRKKFDDCNTDSQHRGVCCECMGH